MTVLAPGRTEAPPSTAARRRVPAWGHSVALVVATALAMALAVAVLVAGATPAAAQASGPAPALTGGLECPPEASGGDAKGALMETFIPDEGPGCFPTSAYRIDFDDGDWKAISRKVLGSSTEFIAGLGRWLVGASLWIVSWAFTFGFAANLAQPFADLAGRYQSSFAAPLVHFALVITATYAAWHAYRGRLTRGIGEFGLSLLILALCGAFLLSRPKAFLDGSIKAVGSLSGAVVSTAVECGAECQSVSYTCTTKGEFEANPDACGSEYVFNQYKGLIQPLERGVHRAFVEQPYELVQWGRFVEDGVCRDRMNQILAKGPGGDRDRIVNIMANGKLGESAEERLRRSGGSGLAFLLGRDEDKPDGQCDELYEFNREPTMERLGVAALTLISSLIILILLVLVAGTIVAAQLVAVALIAVLPFAVLGGALPGGGRQALWRWAASFARALLAIVAMSMCLAFLLVTSNAILSSQSSQGLLVRMVTLNAVTITAFVARRRFLEAGQRLATTFGQRLGQMSVGGQGAGWMGPAAVGGLTGFALARQMREGAVDGQEIVHRVAGTVRRRIHNRQQAGAYARAIGGRAGAGGGYGAAGRSSGGEPVGAPDGGGAGHQRGSSRPASSGSRAGRVAKTGAKVAWGATLGAPVEVPRAYRAARHAASTKAGSVRSRLQQRRNQAWDYVGEGAENLARLVPGVRAARAQEAQEAARRAEAAERRAAQEREEAMEWA